MIDKPKILKVPLDKIEFGNAYFTLPNGVDEKIDLDKYEIIELADIDKNLSESLNSLYINPNNDNFSITDLAEYLINISDNGNFDFIIIPKGKGENHLIVGRYLYSGYPFPIFTTDEL